MDVLKTRRVLGGFKSAALGVFSFLKLFSQQPTTTLGWLLVVVAVVL